MVQTETLPGSINNIVHGKEKVEMNWERELKQERSVSMCGGR